MKITLDINNWGSDCRLIYDLKFICSRFGEKEQVCEYGKRPAYKVTVNKALCKKIFKNIMIHYEGDFDEIEEYIVMNCKDEGMENLFREMRNKYGR